MDKPFVSICCLAYNHELYIRQCLEGFLLQQINFPIEVLIHDDASTDRTADIIHEYEIKYPDIIKPIYETENQFSLGDPNVRFNYNRAKGKYIAICEGDDYWTDPYKLKKQVDFLEANEDYGLVHTNFRIFNEENGIIKEFYSKYSSKNILPHMLKGKYGIGTLTVVFRKCLLNKIDFNTFAHFNRMGDLPLWIEMANLAKVKFLSDITATYRELQNSASHSDDLKKVEEFNLEAVQIRQFYSKRFGIKIKQNKLHSNVLAYMIREYYERNEINLALEYYNKMIGIYPMKLFDLRSLLFLLGTKCSVFDKMVKKIMQLKRKMN